MDWDADEEQQEYDVHASTYDGKAELDKLLAMPPPGPGRERARERYGPTTVWHCTTFRTVQ